MRTTRRNAIDDLRGASRLVVDAVKGVTGVVEAMHQTIGAGPAVLGRPLAWPTRLLTAPVYASIRAVTSLVGAGLEAPLARVAPLVARSAPGPEREAIRAALCGVVGDVLAESRNPLAIDMTFFLGDEPLDSQPEARPSREVSSRLLVLLHGSSMNAAQWRRRGHDHGSRLEGELGFSPLYVEYNSGLHVSVNGRMLAAHLERIVAEWPAQVSQIALVGFSMGGLVARSACHYGELEGHAWRGRLTKLVCMGSPHHGAPLERGGNWLDVLLGVSRYSAPLTPLGRIRSAGVTDMRFGNVRDEDWLERDRFALEGDPRTPLPLPRNVDCYAIAATTAAAPGPRLPSDGLVPVDSALGKSPAPERTLAFPAEHQAIVYAAGHLDLLDSSEAYGKLREWLA